MTRRKSYQQLLRKKQKRLHKYVAFLKKICPEGSKIPCYSYGIIVTVEQWDLNYWRGRRLLCKETRIHSGKALEHNCLLFCIEWLDNSLDFRTVLPVEEVGRWLRGYKHFKRFYTALQNYFPRALVNYMEPFIYPLKIKV